MKYLLLLFCKFHRFILICTYLCQLLPALNDTGAMQAKEGGRKDHLLRLPFEPRSVVWELLMGQVRFENRLKLDSKAVFASSYACLSESERRHLAY
jgi:hypothetical protein